jgi:hypothetical protein
MIFKIENRRNYTVKKPWRMMNFGYPIWIPRMVGWAHCAILQALGNDSTCSFGQWCSGFDYLEFWYIWRILGHFGIKMQFLGHITYTIPSMVWRSWDTPKCKIFARLVLQNRVWTTDMLHTRGWQNCGLISFMR